MTAAPRRRRFKDRKLLDEYKTLPCVCCGDTPSDPAHIRSVGASGDDAWENILPLARGCHIRQHTLGWVRFAKMHPGVMMALTLRGWILVEETGRTRLTKKTWEHE